MNRIGFDNRIHPYQLQLRVCSMLDPQGLQNKESTTINFQEGKITKYHTADNQISTAINEYVASDEELKDLYEFFTLEALAKFESMPESEKDRYATGYYDCATLLYLLFSEEGPISDGKRNYVYTNDPIEMALRWISRTMPSDID